MKGKYYIADDSGTIHADNIDTETIAAGILDDIIAQYTERGEAVPEGLEVMSEESATATALNPLGMYDYIVTGARATEAADDLEQRLDSLSRSPFPVAPERTGEIASEVAQTYGVVVTTTIGGARYE